MGEYLKTHYPGIFKYVGKHGTVYGIDYYAGGKKHREIIGSLLSEAQDELQKRREAKGGSSILTTFSRSVTRFRAAAPLHTLER